MDLNWNWRAEVMGSEGRRKKGADILSGILPDHAQASGMAWRPARVALDPQVVILLAGAGPMPVSLPDPNGGA